MAGLLFLNGIEMTCYWRIAKDLHRQNKSMIGILNRTAIQKRTRGNAISLGGQIIAFFVELLMSVFLTLTIRVSVSDLNSVLPVLLKKVTSGSRACSLRKSSR